MKKGNKPANNYLIKMERFRKLTGSRIHWRCSQPKQWCFLTSAENTILEAEKNVMPWNLFKCGDRFSSNILVQQWAHQWQYFGQLSISTGIRCINWSWQYPLSLSIWCVRRIGSNCPFLSAANRPSHEASNTVLISFVVFLCAKGSSSGAVFRMVGMTTMICAPSLKRTICDGRRHL